MFKLQPAELVSSEVPAPPLADITRLASGRRLSLLVASCCWLYTFAVPLTLHFGLLPRENLQIIAVWAAAPVQCAAIVFGVGLLLCRGIIPQPQRAVWWLVLTFTILNLLATIVWNTVRPDMVREELGIADYLYIVDYWILIAAFGVLFFRAGGSFRHPRVWLDAATMVTVQLAALWSFFLAPTLPSELERNISLGAATTYSFTLASILAIMALVCLQLSNYRGRLGILLLIAGAASIVASEINWMASWMVGYDFNENYENCGDLLCFTCIITASLAVQYQEPLYSGAINTEKQAFSFLPALAVLLSIALVAGTLATTRRWDAWIVVALVAFCALLLITRQASVRKELQVLNQRLAMRDADARLTELVRRSFDLIMVVDPDGIISFASPAAEALLGVTAAALQGTRVVRVFGALHEDAMRRMLSRVIDGVDVTEVIELKIKAPSARLRYVKIGAANQSDNPVIGGVVLTVHDVTEQRELEREVLDIATRERIRLCGDIHDGLGQELTGIALLLHAAATTPNPNPRTQREQLESIVDQVNRTIGTARDLARGFSPLHVVRGSLCAALRRVAHDAAPAMAIRLGIESNVNDKLIGDFAADHLYRIAQEAVTNAMRHSGGNHVDIALRSVDGNLILAVFDNGAGITHPTSEETGLGLRLMSSRARLIGGALRVIGSPDGGTCIEVTMPLPLALPAA